MKSYTKVLLLLLPAIVHFIFICVLNITLGDSFISFIDSGVLIAPLKDLKDLTSLWNNNNLGVINSLLPFSMYSKFLSQILLAHTSSIKEMQLLFYFFLFNAIFYSAWHAFYLIQKKVLQSNAIVIPLIAAAFYSYNLSIISLTGILDVILNIVIAAPYILYFCIKITNDGLNLRTTLISALLIAFTINFPPYSFALYLVFGTAMLLNFNKHNATKSFFGYLGLMIALVGILAAPFIYVIVHDYTRGDPFPDAINVSAGLIFLSTGVNGLFQFFYDWTLNVFNDDRKVHPYYVYYQHSWGIISSYLIWIGVFTGISLGWRKITDKRSLLFLLTSLIVALFIIKGNQEPFGFLNTYLYEINPIFSIFRTPGSKFGLIITLCLSALILYVLIVTKNRLIIVLLTCCIFLQTFKYFDPVRFTGIQSTRLSKTLAQLPAEYEDTISILNNSKKEGAVLFYPSYSAGNYDLTNNITVTTHDILGEFIRRPVIYSDGIIFTSARKYISNISKNFPADRLGEASIRYIVVRKDFNKSKYKGEVSTIKEQQFLVDNPNYKNIYNSKLIAIYELDPSLYKNMISLKTQNDTRETIPTYRMINPNHYVVKIPSKILADTTLVLRTSYHQDWEVYDSASNKLSIEHDVYNTYANMWKIETLQELEGQEIHIKYAPQQIWINLMIFSCVSLLAVILLLVFLSRDYLKNIRLKKAKKLL